MKLLEEPPTYSIFIFCTTDPQKIPKTILSRVQRYDFQRISHQGIVQRLTTILAKEEVPQYDDGVNAVNYIAKVADGGMRDAITMLDKCLAYSKELTVENVVKILGLANYDIMFELTDHILNNNPESIINTIEELHCSGKDLKQFVKDYTHFVLDIKKYLVGCPMKYISIPETDDYMDRLKGFVKQDDYYSFSDLLTTLISLSGTIKYSSSPKIDIEAALISF